MCIKKVKNTHKLWEIYSLNIQEIQFFVPFPYKNKIIKRNMKNQNI